MLNYLGNQFRSLGGENSLHWVLDVALNEKMNVGLGR